MSPTSTKEVKHIINSFYLNKALEPNSVPIKILEDLKKELSKPLTNLIMLTLVLEYSLIVKNSKSSTSF